MWALAQVFVYWRLARADHRFGLLLWIVAVAIIVIVALARHDSAAQLAWTPLRRWVPGRHCRAALLAVAMRRHRAGDLPGERPHARIDRPRR